MGPSDKRRRGEIFSPGLVNSSVLLTNASGIHRIPISEMIMAMTLALAKKLHKFMQFKSEAKWKRIRLEEFSGKIFGLLGLDQSAWRRLGRLNASV